MNNIEQYKERFYNLMESTMGDVKPLINEQSVPKGWEQYPCVPKHPDAKYDNRINAYRIGEYLYTTRGTKIYKPGKSEYQEIEEVSFTCNDPIFKQKTTQTTVPVRNTPKTEEDLSKPGYNLQLNDRGPLVQKLQRLLFNAAEGYANMMKTNKLKKPNFTPFDGIFGPTTKSTVIEFQKDNQLKPDGVVGPKTWNLLKDIRLKYDWDVAKQTTIDTEQSNQMAKITPKTVTQLPPQV